MYHIFTSESVSEGHPDKICDQVSDAILDAILSEDKNARVACETLAKTGLILVAGEITTGTWVDIEEIVRETVKGIGYVDSDIGFDGNTCAVINAIGKQSHDIAVGVDETNDHEQGAGDQGMMFGYACDETEEYMPTPIVLAHKLVRQQAILRRTKHDWLRPDAKSQVTIKYDDDKNVASIEAIVLSTQHSPKISHDDLVKKVKEDIIIPVLPESLITLNTKLFINPTGIFEVGGPVGDCGLTGRKIIVDTYGGMAHHGGGAFSGKDPSKVDRSAAYMCRYVAKNVVAAGFAKKCEVQVSYAIGIAEPVSISVNTFNSSYFPEEKIEKAIKEVFDMRPKAIIDILDLKNVKYRPTAAYGHFGRNDLELPWEKINKVSELKRAIA